MRLIFIVTRTLFCRFVNAVGISSSNVCALRNDDAAALPYRSDIQGITRLRYNAVMAITIDAASMEEFIEFNSFLDHCELLVKLDPRAKLATFIHSHFTQTCRCLISV